MAFDSLGDSLRNTLKKITDAIFVDEKLINELVKDIQKALIKADTNIKLVLELTTKIKQRALKEKPPAGINKKEFLINIVYEELVAFIGKGDKVNYKEQVLQKKPYKIMLVGLFGSGKTTTTGKLANYFKKRGFKVAVMSTDTWRPAAYDQLKQVAEKVKVDFFGDSKEKKPDKIYKKFEKELNKYDIVLIDTAGRDALNEELTDELKLIKKTISVDESFLVLSGDIGQAAEKQGKAFHEYLGITGIIITKLDGTARGGGSLIACSVTGAPIRFIGVGEKIQDLEEFRPEGFVSRLLGMGDLEALLEKTKEAISEEKAEDLGKKFLKGDFNFLDMYEQMQAMKKMGSFGKILDMIPGFSSVPKEMLKGQEEKMEKWKYLMQSMTKKELEEPELLNHKRLERISKGSGSSIGEIRSLLKHYKQSKKMMKMMKGSSEKDMMKMMQKMRGKGLKF